MSTEEAIKFLNGISYQITTDDPYDLDEQELDLYNQVKIIENKATLLPEDEKSISLVVEFQGNTYLYEYMYSSWVGEFGDSKGFLPAEKYTYTEERYRHV